MAYHGVEGGGSLVASYHTVRMFRASWCLCYRVCMYWVSKLGLRRLACTRKSETCMVTRDYRAIPSYWVTSVDAICDHT